MHVVNKILTEKNLHANNCAFVDDLTSHGLDFRTALLALREVLHALREKRMYISLCLSRDNLAPILVSPAWDRF